MTGKVVVVSGIVAVLGIISVVAGFAAEYTRIRASEVRIVRFSCVYPSSPTHGLGILAIVCAIITRIILLIVGGCFRHSNGPTSTPIYIVVNILSWTTSVVAVILFIAGVMQNNRKCAHEKDDGRLTCYVVKPGIFAAGAILSILSIFFGIAAYSFVSSATQTTSQLELELPVAGDVDVGKIPVHPLQYYESNGL